MKNEELIMSHNSLVCVPKTKNSNFLGLCPHKPKIFNNLAIYLIIIISLSISCNQKTENKTTTISIDSPQIKSVKNAIINDTIKPKMDTTIKYPSSDLVNEGKNLLTILEKMRKGDSVKIVCYGNSITRGYKVGTYEAVENPYPKVLENLLQKKYNNLKIKLVNEGHNGWRSDQGLNNLPNLVIAKKPDLVILEFGINDAYSNFSLKLYESKIQSIINQLVTNKIQVLILSPTPIHTSYNAKVLEYCQVLKKLTENLKTPFFHLHQAISQRAEKEQVKPIELLPDDVHFADEKYAWLAEAIFEFLNAIK